MTLTLNILLDPAPFPQGSPEWKALFNSTGAGRTGVVLPLEAMNRESIYGNEGRWVF